MMLGARRSLRITQRAMLHPKITVSVATYRFLSTSPIRSTSKQASAPQSQPKPEEQSTAVAGAISADIKPADSITPAVANTAGTPAAKDDTSTIEVKPGVVKYWMRKGWAEVKHYYYGTKLLFKEISISFRLHRKKVNGHRLTWREQRQVQRTDRPKFRTS